MKILLTALVAFIFATSVSAETRYATVTSVETNYKTVYEQVPTTECELVEVPVYGQQRSGASGGDVLTGMIIGGLIGKGVTGKDGGAAAGAVMGGVIAADQGNNRQVVTGYRTERQCTEVMTRQQRQIVHNYIITYQWSGINGRTYTYNQYRVGQRIPVTVTINAN